MEVRKIGSGPLEGSRWRLQLTLPASGPASQQSCGIPATPTAQTILSEYFYKYSSLNIVIEQLRHRMEGLHESHF